MQKLLYIFLIFCPITALTQSIFQAGQIKVDYIGGSAFFVLKVNVEMVATLTQNPPSAVNICWGDGLCEDISLINTSIQEDFLLLSYEGFHTYPEVGTYVISAAPCCFINFSSNIPESGEKAFPLEVKYTFYNPDSIGTNEIPRIGQPLIDV